MLVLCLVMLTLPVTASIQRDSQRMFEPRPAAGKYLVASESLRDPRFRQTVILLINHDDQGSLGVIVNRPSEVSLSEIIDGAGTQRVYFGGPVQTRVFSMLYRSDQVSEVSDDEEGPEIMRIIEDVDFVLGFNAVTALYPQLDDDDPYRIYAGYAGWSAGQLEAEIENGGWHLISESTDPIFSDRPERVWETLMRKLRGQWI